MVTRQEEKIELKYNIQYIEIERFEKYKNLLYLDSIETIETLIRKYSKALSTYYLEMNDKICDLQKLSDIVDAFFFFLNLKEISIESLSKFYLKGVEILSKNALERMTDFEILFHTYFHITKKVTQFYSLEEAKKIILEIEVFAKMKYSLAFIYQYEEDSKEFVEFSNEKFIKQK